MSPFLLGIFLLISHARSAFFRHASQDDTLKESRVMKDQARPTDPHCNRGITDMKREVCCSPVCWTCHMSHPMSGNKTKYFHSTGQDADLCVATIVKNKNAFCEKSEAPCKLSAEYQRQRRAEMMLPINEARHQRNRRIVKQREFRQKLFDEVKKNYDFGLDIAADVRKLSNLKVVLAETNLVKYKKLLAGGNKLLKVGNAVNQSGPLRAQWEEAIENNEDERRFYTQIRRNARWVYNNGTEGLARVDDMKVKIQVDLDKIDEYAKEVDRLEVDSKRVHKDAKALWKQWVNSAEHYDCDWKPWVDHALLVCKVANTLKRKCPVTCLPGYDSKKSRNDLRCLKQGKFGQELYGEMSGIATCVGRNCGKPPKLVKATAVIQDIIYPNKATYTCFEGHSVDGSAKGAKGFDIPCETKGEFHVLNKLQKKQQCEPIRCGAAPKILNSVVENPKLAKKGKYAKPEYVFTERVKYACNTGYTVTGAAGGVDKFEINCQGSGEFTQPQSCRPVSCGPAGTYVNTKLLTKVDGDRHFPQKLDYKCEEGYSLDQKFVGPTSYTLACAANGEYVWEGHEGELLPVCRPVSAGMSPKIEFGDFLSREMFYGESAVVVAEPGYSTVSHPDRGLQFTINVTKEGKYSGIKVFKPVDCGAPPKPDQSKHHFGKETAVFKDFVTYDCTLGYSTDATKSRAAKNFTIHCEADGSFSQIPGKGHCVNIDDCAEHTCGAFGHCVDLLQNYSCNCISGYKEKVDESGEKLCGNIDDCGPEACGVGECIDGVNDYECECPDGYHVVVNAEGKTCAKVTCGTPPRVAHGLTQPVEAAGTKAFFEQTVLYQCGTGYTLDGHHQGKNHFTIDCRADKTFSGLETCKPIECGDAPSVANAKSGGASATYNQSIRYECEHGYTIDRTPHGDNHFSVTCQDTGDYSLPLECLKITCGEPDQVANAQRSSGKRHFGDVVDFECFEGFTIDGHRDSKTEFTSECQANGNFTKTETCNPKICGHPPKLIHVLYAQVPDMGNVHYPDVAEIACRDGYTVGGDPRGNATFQVKCQKDGNFARHDPRECEPVRCGKVPQSWVNSTFNDIVDMVTKDPVVTDVLKFGLRARYTCAEGFTQGGEHGADTDIAMECNPNGAFSQPAENMRCRNVNDCDLHTCGPHGKCVDLVGKAPAYTCDCKHGYELNTLPNGEKVCGNIDDCGKRGCGPGVCQDLVGDYTCICPSGHYLGKVDGDKTCIPVKCADEVPSVDNGKLLTDHKGAVVFPVTLRFKCDAGYSTDASPLEAKEKFLASCKAHGLLMGMMACQPIACGSAHVFPFTKLNFPANKRQILTFGQSAKYECIPGYSIKGTPDGATKYDARCLENGVLTDPEVCEPIKCGRAPRMPKCRAAVAGVVSFGMDVQYECDKGHTLTGTPRGGHHFHRKCEKDGAFEASEAVCKPMNAGPVPKVQNANLMSYAGRNVEGDAENLIAYYPQGLEYKCLPGYTLSGGPSGQTKFVTQVNSAGEFVPALPAKCKLTVFTIKGEIKNAVTGAGLEDADVQIVGRLGQVKSELGFFTLEGIGPGTLKLKYTKDNFIPTVKTLEIAGDVHSGGIADISMSPKMQPSQWRAVVKWGSYPEDLDTYASWFTNQVCWYNEYAQSSITGKLEVDDTDGYGPETIYFSDVGTCKGDAFECDLKYMINDYEETGEMYDRSEASVTLYHGEAVAGTWDAASCPDAFSEDGNWWHVFTIDTKANALKWHCGQAAMLLNLGKNATLSDDLIRSDFKNYVGPFPGRYQGKHKQKRNGFSPRHRGASRNPIVRARQLTP